MEDKTQPQVNNNTITEVNAESTTKLAVVEQQVELDSQAAEVLNQIIPERDPDKIKDLTYLFNLNQNKKTMARVDKCNAVLDSLLNQLALRISKRPDELSHDDLMRGIKTIQELMERGQRQVAEVNEAPAPIIQINQQNNEIKVGDGDSLSRESRERVKKAVMGLLAGLNTASSVPVETPVEDSQIVDVEVIDDGK